jgi:hypothetical protein
MSINLLEATTQKGFFEILTVFTMRFLLPFLLGGFTFHFGLGSRQLVVSVRADIARLEKKLDETQKAQSAILAGVGFTLPTATSVKQNHK